MVGLLIPAFMISTGCEESGGELDGEGEDSLIDTIDDQQQDHTVEIADMEEDLSPDTVPDAVPDTAPDTAPDVIPDVIPDAAEEDIIDEEVPLPSGRLVYAGVISSLHVSPTEDAIFFFHNDGYWNNIGGMLGTAGSTSGLISDLGMDSYTTGFTDSENVGGRRLFYYKEIGFDMDTPLAMATLHDVSQLSFNGNNSCLHVEEDGFAAYVDVYMEPPEGEWYQTGTIKIVRAGSSTVEWTRAIGACGVDESSSLNFVPALSPDGQWMAYYDYSFYSPDWANIELSLLQISPDVSTDPQYIALYYNAPRAVPAFTSDSSKLVYLDNRDNVTVYPVDDPSSAFTFDHDTYPTLQFKVISNSEVLFPAENTSGDMDIVLGDLETGETGFLNSPHGWGRMTLPETEGYVFVSFHSDGGLYLLDVAAGTFTLVESEEIFWDTRQLRRQGPG